MYFTKKYPRLYRLQYGFYTKIYTSHPDLIRQVFTSSKAIKKPHFYRFFGWGTGLATASGKKDRKVTENFANHSSN